MGYDGKEIMTDESREAYNELMELIEEAGFIVVDEEFSSDNHESEFNVDLWLIPPAHVRGGMGDMGVPDL